MSDAFQAMLDRYVEAILHKRPEDLACLYANDVGVFDTWDSWSIEGMKAWRENLLNWLGSLGAERVEVRFEDVTTKGDEAFGYLSAVGRYTAIDANGAATRSMQNRLTWVLKRTDGKWLIIHEHTSAPISSSDTKAILKRD